MNFSGMNGDDATLFVFSMGVVVVSALFLIVPVLLRKSDVFTAWNFFLVGVLTFNGRSGMTAATTPHYLPELDSEAYTLYYVGTVLFYAAAAGAYYGVATPGKLAGRTFRRWADMTPLTTAIIATALMSFIVFLVVPVQIPFVGQVLASFGQSGPVIALGMATIAWYRNRTNPLLLALLIGFAILAVAGAVGAGISRRNLISALFGAAVALYWVWLRYKPTPQIAIIILSMMAATIPVVAAYTSIRFALKEQQVSVVQRAQIMLQALPDALKSGGSTDGLEGQDSVECALSAIHLIGTRDMPVKPFESLLYVLCNPIPRSYWPDKPSSVAIELPYYFGLPATEGFSLGLNVVGQCYYDGGFYAHLIYGFIVGFALRYFDELLVRQPGNPLLIGCLAAMSAQILSWPRGCVGVVTMQVVQAVILMILVKEVSRLIFGTKVVYPRTDHLSPYPILRSQDDWQRWMQSVTAVTPQHLLRRQAQAAEG